MSKKLRSVEAIRGVAAFIVFLDHFACIFFPKTAWSAMGDPRYVEYGTKAFLLNLALNGDFSVCVFFVLSGYVLSRAYFLRGNLLDVRRAAMKRYPRLMLPALSSLLVVWLAMMCGTLHFDEAIALSGSVWENPFVGDWSLIDVLYHGIYRALFAGDNRLNPVLWTLQIELYGSFLVFSLLVMFQRTRYRWIAYALCAALLRDSYYLAFPIGVAAAALRRARRDRPWLAVVLGLVALVLGSYPYYGAQTGLWHWLKLPGSAEPHIFYHTLGGALLLGAVLTLPSWTGLDGPVFQFLGRISYSLYLLHFIILATLTSWLVTRIAPALGYLPAAGIGFVVTLPVTLLAAYGFARGIDEPSVRLAARLARMIVDRGRGRRIAPAATGAPLPSAAPAGRNGEVTHIAEDAV